MEEIPIPWPPLQVGDFICKCFDKPLVAGGGSLKGLQIDGPVPIVQVTSNIIANWGKQAEGDAELFSRTVCVSWELYLGGGREEIKLLGWERIKTTNI